MTAYYILCGDKDHGTLANMRSSNTEFINDLEGGKTFQMKRIPHDEQFKDDQRLLIEVTEFVEVPKPRIVQSVKIPGVHDALEDEISKVKAFVDTMPGHEIKSITYSENGAVIESGPVDMVAGGAPKIVGPYTQQSAKDLHKEALEYMRTHSTAGRIKKVNVFYREDEPIDTRELAIQIAKEKSAHASVVSKAYDTGEETSMAAYTDEIEDVVCRVLKSLIPSEPRRSAEELMDEIEDGIITPDEVRKNMFPEFLNGKFRKDFLKDSFD